MICVFNCYFLFCYLWFCLLFRCWTCLLVGLWLYSCFCLIYVNVILRFVIVYICYLAFDVCCIVGFCCCATFGVGLSLFVWVVYVVWMLCWCYSYCWLVCFLFILVYLLCFGWYWLWCIVCWMSSGCLCDFFW